MKRETSSLPETASQEDSDYRKRRKIISLLSIAGILIVFVVITCTVGNRVLDFVKDPEGFRQWAGSQGILGRIVLVAIMAMQVVIAIMPGEIIEIGAGYTFGSLEGMLLCLLGAAAGSSLIYCFTKRFGFRLAEAFITREKMGSLRFLRNSKRLNLLIFLLFFLPGTPKDLITYFIGLTPMRLSTFLILSSIARIPSVITSTVTGNALGVQDYRLAVIVFVCTAIVSAAGLWCYYRISQKGDPAVSEKSDEIS